MEIQKVIWEKKESFGTEYFRLALKDEFLSGAGTVIFEEEKIPNKASYVIDLDRNWRTKKVTIEVEGAGELVISSNGDGKWFHPDGSELDELRGAIDVDISVTPFTNSFPINRYDWEPNQKRDFKMVYVEVPDLNLHKISQAYTYIERKGDTRIFYYQCRDFESLIYVDNNGLVTEYPGLFMRK